MRGGRRHGTGQAIVIVLRLELRIDGHAQLPGNKRHEYKQQGNRAKRLIARHCLAQPTTWRNAHQGDRNQQVQPQPGGRIEFVKAQDQRSKRDNTGTTPEQSPDGNRNNQNQEEIEQLPLTHPAAVGAVDTAGTQQLVSWRQVQRRRNASETSIPACNRHRGASIDPAERLHSNRRLPDFDAGLAFLLTESDQQARIVFSCAQQRVRPLHVQPPVGAHCATNAVLDDEATAIEIKPHCPLQGQFIRR